MQPQNKTKRLFNCSKKNSLS